MSEHAVEKDASVSMSLSKGHTAEKDAPSRWRKKPVEIEAIQWLGEQNCEAVFAFVGLPHSDDEQDHSVLLIPTLEGTMEASPGDWIIRGVQGEHYPCKPDIFEATYERVTPPAETALPGDRIAGHVMACHARRADPEWTCTCPIPPGVGS